MGIVMRCGRPPRSVPSVRRPTREREQLRAAARAASDPRNTSEVAGAGATAGSRATAGGATAGGASNAGGTSSAGASSSTGATPAIEARRESSEFDAVAIARIVAATAFAAHDRVDRRPLPRIPAMAAAVPTAMPSAISGTIPPATAAVTGAVIPIDRGSARPADAARDRRTGSRDCDGVICSCRGHGSSP